MALKLAPVGTIQMVNEDGVYTIKGNNKKMLDCDGCLYTDSYCFHGTYVFKYNTDILLGNFYYAPSNTASDGSFTINFADHSISTNNLVGAYSLPAWFNDLCFMLTKRTFTVKMSVCKGSKVNSQSGTEQSAFLTNGGFNKSDYSAAYSAPSLLGHKVTSVTGSAISASNGSITATNTTKVANNLYYTVYVSLT